jgi:uncharacterized Fe-S cluster-containing MiaB family protein
MSVSANSLEGRFGRATGKDPRAIMVIDSPGCSWGHCRFCAIHNAHATESEMIDQVNYCFKQLEPTDTKIQIVCSASFSDYPLRSR